MKTIAIIGGGAAGLAAAITAASVLQRTGHAARILLVERLDRVGKKILATGNGRCNLTNTCLSPSDHHSSQPDAVKTVLSQYPPKKIMDFFAEIGLLCKVQADGKTYPYSFQASSVLDVLRYACMVRGIEERCGFPVCRLTYTSKGFLLESPDGQKQRADRVIVATGGKAAPGLGANGSGYALVQSFGHTCTPLFPSLVQLKSSNPSVRPLKGIRAYCRADAEIKGQIRRSEWGEVLFTEYGLSGIPILQLSRIFSTQTGKTKGSVRLDLLPDLSEEALAGMLSMRKKQKGEMLLEHFLLGLISKKIAHTLLKELGLFPLSRPSATLSPEELQTLAFRIKHWTFPVTGTLSWDSAQITAGGLLCHEFNLATMESRLQKGLYTAGEILDVDGDCGGFNLHWAWSTGCLAGQSAAESLFL